MSVVKGHIFIAGASSDIGFSISKILNKNGEKLILHTSSDKGYSRLFQEFGSSSPHEIIRFDFEEVKEIEVVLSELFLKKPLIGLINCVGLRSRRPLKLLKPKHVEKVFQVNFFSFLELIRISCTKNRYLPGFSIIQISSIAASSGGVSVTVYAASKAAGDVAVRSLAKELHSKGVRLNSIRCGQVKTAAYEKLQADKSFDPVLDRQYMGLIDPNDISELVLFLLSKEANKITGQYFNLDGGYLQ